MMNITQSGMEHGYDEEIFSHIKRHIGVMDSVFHELISPAIHVDVYHVPPGQHRHFHVFVTSGMSRKPMTVPEGMEEHRYAELCILLPVDWPIHLDEVQTLSAIEKQPDGWAVTCLPFLARFPHIAGTWFGWGHSIPNGEQEAPFAPDTRLCCMWLLPSLSLPEDFSRMQARDGNVIRFYCLYPLYPEEYAFKQTHGSKALIGRVEKYGISDVIDSRRQNVCL